MKWAFTIWNKSDFGDEDLKTLMESGYSAVEVSIDSPWPYSPDFRDVIDTISRHGLEIAFHAPWRDVQLASPYDHISRASVNVVKETIDIVSVYEPSYIVIHLQTREEIELNDWYIQKIEDTLKDLSAYGDSKGIEIVVENTRGGVTEDPDLFRELLDRAGLKACLDVGRLLPKTLSESFTLGMIERWINTLSEKIGVVHIHRVGKREGKLSEHFSIIGAENMFIGIIKRIQTFNPDLTVTLEVFYTHTGADVNTRYLAEMLSRILSLLK